MAIDTGAHLNFRANLKKEGVDGGDLVITYDDFDFYIKKFK